MLKTSQRWNLHGLSICCVFPGVIFTMWATSVAAGSTVAVPLGDKTTTSFAASKQE
jgi:hypothetical protein